MNSVDGFWNGLYSETPMRWLSFKEKVCPQLDTRLLIPYPYHFSSLLHTANILTNVICCSLHFHVYIIIQLLSASVHGQFFKCRIYISYKFFCLHLVLGRYPLLFYTSTQRVRLWNSNMIYRFHYNWSNTLKMNYLYSLLLNVSIQIDNNNSSSVKLTRCNKAHNILLIIMFKLYWLDERNLFFCFATLLVSPLKTHNLIAKRILILSTYKSSNRLL